MPEDDDESADAPGEREAQYFVEHGGTSGGIEPRSSSVDWWIAVGTVELERSSDLHSTEHGGHELLEGRTQRVATRGLEKVRRML